jgi:hypothetical protein
LVNESGIDCILHTWQLHSGFQLHFALEVVWTWTRFRNLLLFPFFCVIIRKNFTTRIEQEKEKRKKGVTIVPRKEEADKKFM